MLSSRLSRNVVVVGSVVAFVLAAAAIAQAPDVLSGEALLRAIRERTGRGPKPAYADRPEGAIGVQEQAVPVGPLRVQKPVTPVERVTPVKRVTPAEPVKPLAVAAPAPSQPVARTVSGDLLEFLPPETLFCARMNNFGQTLGALDQFLLGVSPVPGAASMALGGQLGQMLGNPQLKGLDMAGSLAIFGVQIPGRQPTAAPTPNLFVGILLPVTGYAQFVSSSPNCSQPDANGISKLAGQGTPPMVLTQIGNYALLTKAANYDNLAAMQIVMRRLGSSGASAGLSAALDADEARVAKAEPIWAFASVQQTSKTFGPFISAQLEQMKTRLQQTQTAVPAPMADPEAIVSMYSTILETLLKETRSVSLAVRPQPNALNLSMGISAMPGTDMANMFAGGVSAGQENPLLKYLEDGAMMNIAGTINTPLLESLYAKAFDWMALMVGQSAPAADMAEWKALVSDMVDSLAGPAALSLWIDTKSKPPFAIKYVLAIKDANKFNQVMDRSVKMMNTGAIAQFYKSLGFEMSYTVQRGVDQYNGISIDAAKFVMKAADANQPQAQLINAMYGDGFLYRWAMVDQLWVCVVGGDVDQAIRRLIDEVKAVGIKPVASELQAALALVPQAGRADFVATYNFVRTLNIIPAMMGAMMPVPMPEINIPTKSNFVLAGKAGNGKMTIDMAVPKEHLMEIMQVMTTMQQQQIKMKGTSSKQPIDNLRAIGRASLVYASEYEDKFPPNLQELVAKMELPPQCLESERKPAGFAGPSYIYVAGQTTEAKPGNILVYENPTFCSDDIYVLFVDCHVELMKPAEFLQALRATCDQLGRPVPQIEFRDSTVPTLPTRPPAEHPRIEPARPQQPTAEPPNIEQPQTERPVIERLKEAPLPGKTTLQQGAVAGVIRDEAEQTGTVISTRGEAVYGSNGAYAPDEYLGKVEQGAKLQLLDRQVIRNQFGLPIIKVKTLTDSSTVPANSTGWIALAGTTFVDHFELQSTVSGPEPKTTQQPPTDQSLDAARQDVVRAKIANIETALVRFRIDCGRYPDEAEGLWALITAPANLGDTWQGPYLKQPELVDPWGNPYVYVEHGTVNPDGFDLLSYGADGKAGGGGGDTDIYNRKR